MKRKQGADEAKLRRAMDVADPDKPAICATCGTRYSQAKYDAAHCLVCEDDRQYVPSDGQRWTSYDRLLSDHCVAIKRHADRLHELKVIPEFAIAQRAFLIESAVGNVLWDCLPLIDAAALAFVESRGGLAAIAISHPHYYGLMVEWARLFDCPIYLHEEDRQWVMDDDQRVEFWQGARQSLVGNLSIVHTGGHFPGSTILYCADSETVFVGDSLQISRDMKHLSVMHSFPNYIPLTGEETLQVFRRTAPLRFDAMFGAFSHQNLPQGARGVFDQSLKRYEMIFGGRGEERREADACD